MSTISLYEGNFVLKELRRDLRVTPTPAIFRVGPICDRLGHLSGTAPGGDPISAAVCSYLWTGSLAGASEHLDPATPAPGLAGSDHRSTDGLRASRL